MSWGGPQPPREQAITKLLAAATEMMEHTQVETGPEIVQHLRDRHGIDIAMVNVERELVDVEESLRTAFHRLEHARQALVAANKKIPGVES